MRPSSSTRWVEVVYSSNDSSHDDFKQVLESTSNADPATLTLSNQPRGGEMDANGLRGNTLADLGISWVPLQPKGTSAD